VSRPGWLTYSGRLTHISGHPSAAGRAQDSESSAVRDRRSTTVPRNQPNCVISYLTEIGYSTLNNGISLKSGLGVVQGHLKWHYLIDPFRVPIVFHRQYGLFYDTIPYNMQDLTRSQNNKLISRPK